MNARELLIGDFFCSLITLAESQQRQIDVLAAYLVDAHEQIESLEARVGATETVTKALAHERVTKPVTVNRSPEEVPAVAATPAAENVTQLRRPGRPSLIVRDPALAQRWSRLRFA